MNETVGWALAATVASLALLSLGATAGLQRDASTQHAAERPATAQAAAPAPSVLLADAYFRIAREAPGLSPGDEGWYIRHEITLKGVAAQRGEEPLPEEPDEGKLAPADAPAFSQAGRIVEGWRARLGVARSFPPDIAALTAQLQVQYDWWLLLAEAGAPRPSLDMAHRLYDEIAAKLAQAAAQSRIAAL